MLTTSLAPLRQLGVALPLLVAVVPSRAEPLTSASQMDACATLTSFESLPIGARPNPSIIDEVVFSTPGLGLGIASVSGFPANGGQVSGRTLLPRPSGSFGGSPYADIVMLLPVPAREVGLGWFDPNFLGNRLEVYSSSGTLLEFINVPTFPAGGCCAAFVGIRRPTAEIARVVAHVSAPTDVFGIDNLRITYGVTPPQSQLVCPLGTVTFFVTAAGASPFTYQWRRHSVAIDSIANPTAVTQSLVLAGVTPADADFYDCVVTNVCGSVTSAPATLAVCPADFNCSGTVDFFDYDDFVVCFEDPACIQGDFNADGSVDFFDYDDFVLAFDAGC